MKKLLLSASAMMLVLGASAQTNSELSGNDLTSGNTGYLYSFKAPGNGNDVNTANCTDDVNVWNAFGNNKTTTITMNAAGGLEVVIPATTAASNTRIASVRLTTGNCSILQSGSYLDISAVKDIKVKCTSTADFDFFVIPSSDDGGWISHDGSFAAKTATTSSSTLEFTAADNDWQGGGNLAQVIGWELWLPEGATLANDVTLTIEAMSFGDAMIPNSVQSLESVNGSVFPNPATDVVNVDLGSTSNASVELSDVTGKVVASVNAASGVVALSTANVPAGLYVVSVRSEAGVSTSKVLVK